MTGVIRKCSRISLILNALLFFLTAPASTCTDDTIIKIGSILILSGEGAAWGTASRNGIELAVEKINSEGGVLGKKLVVDHQDDQAEVKHAIAAFTHLTDVARVNFIIGPTWSRLGLPLIEMAARKKVVMISPTLGMAKFNESSEFLFNTRPHDFISSGKLAEYVYSRGHRNVAVVGAEEPWVKEQTEEFSRKFETLGGKIGFLTEPNPGTTDLRTEALKIIRNTQLEAVVSTTNGVIIGSLLGKSLREIGSNLPMYSVTLDQAAIDSSQGGFEGLHFVTFFSPQSDYKAAYEQRFKTNIDVGADSAYDAVMILANAIQRAGTVDTTIVARELANVRQYEGVSGVLVSDGKHGFTKDIIIKKVVAGKPVDIDLE